MEEAKEEEYEMKHMFKGGDKPFKRGLVKKATSGNVLLS